jgi:hypothetical protein
MITSNIHSRRVVLSCLVEYIFADKVMEVGGGMFYSANYVPRGGVFCLCMYTIQETIYCGFCLPNGGPKCTYLYTFSLPFYIGGLVPTNQPNPLLLLSHSHQLN